MTTSAILVAGVLAACTGSPGVDTGDTPSASPTATATATGIGSASPTGNDATATATATASPTEGPLGNAAECENEELGYEVDYPEDWWANERIEPEDDNLTPIPACQYFAPTEVELQPNAGLPNGLAIWYAIREQEIDPSQEVLSEEEASIDGRDAHIVEIEPAPQPGFVPEGSHVYRYIVELDDSRQLVATTDDILQDDARYDESKEILDAMMETLEIED